jgi:hypothetical protein
MNAPHRPPARGAAVSGSAGSGKLGIGSESATSSTHRHACAGVSTCTTGLPVR